MKEKKGFLSYAHSDKELVKKEIIPLLKEMNIDIWFDEYEIGYNQPIYDLIIKGIREVDFVIALYNSRSSYINFEIGAAIGQNKPVIALLNENDNYPADIRNFNFIRYNRDDIQKLRIQLTRAINLVFENVIDKRDYNLSNDKKLIGIQIGTNSKDFEEELRITADLIKLIKEVAGTDNIELVQTSKGSLKSLLSIDFKSWAELLEKLIFFIPEWQRKGAENRKIVAETELINANAQKISKEANGLELENRIKQANAFFDIYERSKKLGLKMQIDDDWLLLNSQELLQIKEPDKINEDKENRQ